MATKELEAIEKISRVEGKGKAGNIDEMEPLERVPPNKEQFDSHLNAQVAKTQAIELPEMSKQRVHLINEIQEVDNRVDRLKLKTPEELMAQTKDVIAQVDEIKRKLKTPDLQLDSGIQVVMQNKLSHVDDKLRLALEKVGGEFTPLETTPVASNGKGLRSPVERFLGMLGKSETQLQAVYQQVGVLGANRQNFNPADLLSVQMKMGFIQQEMEFFTAVLNKALESTKTLMNVQV